MKMLVFAVQFSRGSCRPWRPATAWLVHPVMGNRQGPWPVVRWHRRRRV